MRSEQKKMADTIINLPNLLARSVCWSSNKRLGSNLLWHMPHLGNNLNISTNFPGKGFFESSWNPCCFPEAAWRMTIGAHALWITELKKERNVSVFGGRGIIIGRILVWRIGLWVFTCLCGVMEFEFIFQMTLSQSFPKSFEVVFHFGYWSRYSV